MLHTMNKSVRRERITRSVKLARHVVFFYRQSLKGLFRQHRLRTPTEPVTLQQRFELSETERRQWHEVFGLSDVDERIPFSYFWPAAVRVFFEALTVLGVNYRLILHLKGERTFLPGAALRPERPYQIDSHLADIVRLAKRRAALVIETEITDLGEPARPVMRLRDWILVKRVPRLDLERVALDERFNRESTADLHALSRTKPRFSDPGAPHRRLALVVPQDVGMRYGIVSGDLNFIHTFKALARVFGYPDKFVQGGYTANYLVKAFVHDCGEDLEHVTVRFCRPIFAGQTVELRFDKACFEVVDCEGAVLACGERRVRGQQRQRASDETGSR